MKAKPMLDRVHWRRALVTLAAVVAIDARAQQPPMPPTAPSPLHDALVFFEGTWTVDGANAPDGFREQCSWLPDGRRHMVCRSRWQTASGPREGMSVFSVDAATGDYLYHGFRAGGSVVTQRGRREGEAWIFTAERGAGAERERSRTRIEGDPSGGFVLTDEAARGDGPWSLRGQVRYRRVTQ